MEENRELSEIKITEQEIFDSRRSELQVKTQLYQSQIKQLGNQIEGAREELRSVEEIIDNFEEDLKSKRPCSKTNIWAKQISWNWKEACPSTRAVWAN